MTASMTAYGYTEVCIEIGRVAWELKSVNHRYLEINIHLPTKLRMLETKVREHIARKFKRGKVSCSLSFDAQNTYDQGFSINMDLANSLIKSAESIRASIGDPAILNVIDILRWPGVINQDLVDVTLISEILMQQLDKTLGSAIEMRLREGEKLKFMILDRCQNIASLLDTFKQKLPAIRQILGDRLHETSQKLAIELDQDRLEQEIFLLLQKSDVAEEIDRLTVHLGEIKQVLQKDQPIGRKLDFMMQELNREANTLGSKTASFDYTRVSVELKVLIEQMREQVQNIE